MRKKLIFGTVLVLTLLLLMPSISAIQTDVVKDEILSEIPKDLDIVEIREIFESGKLDKEKHPILYLLAFLWTRVRYFRAWFLMNISFDVPDSGGLEIHSIFLFIRFIWLSFSTDFVVDFMNFSSKILGWNWDIPY